MKLDDIHNLATSGELGTLEFKRSTVQLGLACKTLCGYLNAKGDTGAQGNALGKRTNNSLSPERA